MKIENEWIEYTIKVWVEVKKMLKDVGTISRAMPIVGNVDFPLSMWDHGLKKWAVKGLFILDQLFEETHLKSFTRLQEQFDLPLSDFYKYLQIRHYITNHKEKERIRKIPNGIEQYFITYIEKGRDAPNPDFLGSAESRIHHLRFGRIRNRIPNPTCILIPLTQ